MFAPIECLHAIISNHRTDGRAAKTSPIQTSKETARSATAFCQELKLSLAPNDDAKCTGETQPVSIRDVNDGKG